MKTSDFDYTLPPEFIAQTPVEPRDTSRLMLVNRQDGSILHRHFFDLPDILQSGDLLVFNDTRVIPARLFGKKAKTGGKVELLLLRRMEPSLWECLVKPGKHARPGDSIEISGDYGPVVSASVISTGLGGKRVIRMEDDSQLADIGVVPLPPYIHTPLPDPDRYQTVYARASGSVAAPTAGLHFTPDLFARLEARGVSTAFVTLHIGLDTFRPVKEDDPTEHVIHTEYGIVDSEAAARISEARQAGRRVICVGTTSTRLLEAVVDNDGIVPPFSDWVSLFILPGYRFKAANALITNFHLPRSTLMMLVSAFAGRELIMRAYDEAIAERYRFYSFGDAMLIV